MPQPKPFQPALCARAPFLNDLLELANGDGGYGPQVFVGDRVDVDLTDANNIEGGTVVAFEDGQAVVEYQLGDGLERHTLGEDDYLYVTGSESTNAIWERHQKSDTPDGVAWGDGLVEAALQTRLTELFDTMIANEPVDYHPGSGTTVRDLVHPSLYPCVIGHTKLADASTAKQGSSETAAFDIWGRPYEDSKFQWLPTNLRVSEDGQASFEGYINNLDADRYGSFYPDLARLFEAALPLCESVYGYAQGLDPWQHQEDDCEADLPEPGARSEAPVPVEPSSLRGQTLQVISKLVEYQVDSESSFEGVWHVEGMSHENILATMVYVLDRDEELEGGEIRFKRAYTREEAGQLFWNISQVRTGPIDDLVGESVVPVGSLSTPKGRLLVFPNSHIHKLSPMRSRSGKPARRRIVVFWLVNPATPIVSTSDVPRQQELVSREQALQHRLALMEERKRHKQSLNLREVSLCEH